MNKLAAGSLLLVALAMRARAVDDPDSRPAKLTDRADTDSEVSALVVSNVDQRFGFDRSEDYGRVVVATKSVELAIPLSAINSIVQYGETTWEVKYQAPGGETVVTGELSRNSALTGNSDFGSFSLPLANLRKLQFSQPGAALKPAKRPRVYDQNNRPRTANFNATLTFTDGSDMAVTGLRRNDVYVSPIGDPTIIARPVYGVGCTNYTDLRMLRGETLQIIPFENVKSIEFYSDANVLVRTVKGAEATMKLPERSEEVLEGFTGWSSKGDFYVPTRNVHTITFQDQPPPPDGQTPGTNRRGR